MAGSSSAKTRFALLPGHDEQESKSLACMRHRGGEAAVDRDRLSIDIGRVVSGEEQSHRRPRAATIGIAADWPTRFQASFNTPLC